MQSYKYYLALTSQLPFCSIPLRLDSYSDCQFGCSFCFAKSRGGMKSSGPSKAVNPKLLQQRLERVAANRIQGAVDEFLKKRIPIQFGGMTDPFSPWEVRKEVSLRALEILADHNYPTVISTKSTLIGSPQYAKFLSKGNFYVRISITSINEPLATSVENGVASRRERLELAKHLTDLGVPISVRLQPIIPGFEHEAHRTIELAAMAGAKHISAEFLKLPIETNSHEFARLTKDFPNLMAEYENSGAQRVGRELVMPASRKAGALFALRKHAEALGLIFGFADNEFLMLNTYKSCCNGADLFLRGASFFERNVLGVLKSQLGRNRLFLEFPPSAWSPEKSMLSHLKSRSRVDRPELTPQEKWDEIVRAKWNSAAPRGGPSTYWGVSNTDELDSAGNKVFKLDLDKQLLGA